MPQSVLRIGGAQHYIHPVRGGGGHHHLAVLSQTVSRGSGGAIWCPSVAASATTASTCWRRSSSVLWPARAVNTLEFTDLGALCKRGARAFGKAVNDDDDEDDDEDDAPGGAVPVDPLRRDGQTVCDDGRSNNMVGVDVVRGGDRIGDRRRRLLVAVRARRRRGLLLARAAVVRALAPAGEGLGLRGRAVALLLRRLAAFGACSARRSFAGP